jgi:hypothetical protein
VHRGLVLSRPADSSGRRRTPSRPTCASAGPTPSRPSPLPDWRPRFAGRTPVASRRSGRRAEDRLKFFLDHALLRGYKAIVLPPRAGDSFRFQPTTRVQGFRFEPE